MIAFALIINIILAAAMLHSAYTDRWITEDDEEKQEIDVALCVFLAVFIVNTIAAIKLFGV